MRYPVFLLLSLLTLPAPLIAQPTPGDSTDPLLILQSQLQQGDTIPGIPPPEGQATTGALLYSVDEEAKRRLGSAIYDDYLWGLQHNQSAYEWQGFSTRAIFYVVIVLVFTGVFFSALQFMKAYRRGGGEKAEGAPDSYTELELSLEGIKVSSSVMGIIILVISLAFFYLYLVHVYPINLPD